MPLYEFLCLAKPSLAKPHLVRMMSRVGEIILGDGGFVTNVVSYGEQSLAYDIRKPFERHAKVRRIHVESRLCPCLRACMRHAGRYLADQFRRESRDFGQGRSRTQAKRRGFEVACREEKGSVGPSRIAICISDNIVLRSTLQTQYASSVSILTYGITRWVS